MPVMSRLERRVCTSPPWNLVAERVVLPWALQRANLSGEVLEIGAGSGAMAAGLLRAHPDVRLTVTDIDPAMCESAERRLQRFGPRAEVRVADSVALPFADDTFDAVVSFLMLHHVGAWESAVHEATRVARPGGRVFVYDLLGSRLWELAHGISRSDDIRVVTLRELGAVLQELPAHRIELRHRGRMWFRLAFEIR